MSDMNTDPAQAASDLLVGLWRAGKFIEALPEALRPASRADAYRAQGLLETQGFGPLRGWKIAATSEIGQRHINVPGPLAGRLLEHRLLGEGATVRLGANRMRVAELEFVFRMAADLPPRAEPYAVREVMAAVTALHLGVEVPDARYLDFTAVGPLQLIADNSCADWFVLGPEAPPAWRDLDLASHEVGGGTDRGPRVQGQGANVLGDPRIALTWLANELSQHGVTLQAGQIVTTGTCVVPFGIAPGDRIVGDFGQLGQITVHIAA